jgi:hypothetical protein
MSEFLVSKLIFVLLFLLGWGLPLAVLIGVPSFIIILVIRFCRSDASRLRKVLVIAGAVIAVPFFLAISLFLAEGVRSAGLRLLGKAVGVDKDNTQEVEIVEHHL